MSGNLKSNTYAPPGPGTWEQDGAHNPRPVTAWKSETLREPFARGFSEGTARYGVLFNYLDVAVVNGFLYHSMVMVDPSDGAEVARRFDAARTAFERRIWLEDLERWDRDFKPDSILRNRTLETTPMLGLDTAAFIGHLRAVKDNAVEMVYRHHIFTVASVFPVGNYLANAQQWTGLESGQLLSPLRGSSRVSLGAHEELLRAAASLKAAGLDASSFKGQSARDTLTALSDRSDAVGASMRAYLAAVGMRLAQGYDVCDACAMELPEMLLGAVWAAGEGAAPGDGAEAAAKVRDAVPAAHREAFDELLADARKTNRLRDERGVYNDIWSTGIARQVMLECGRRLAEIGQIDTAELAIDATTEELVALLQGGAGPSNAELVERSDWRRDAPASEVPPILGPAPKPPPPMDALPPHAGMAMRAIGTAMGELFASAPESKGPIITGKPVSPGICTGSARVILDSRDMNRVVQGDVLVTMSTSPAFNVVLPLVGAIVTDRGGQLSHAAIIAREYGIPAVVGTLRATAMIPDGALVEVNGTTGEVRLL